MGFWGWQEEKDTDEIGHATLTNIKFVYQSDYFTPGLILKLNGNLIF
jgi:hypothetical protein